MNTGGWEVVGKNKKNKSNEKSGKLSKSDKKKFVENAPKVEDFLPLNQVKTLYDSLQGNTEHKKPTKEKESKTKENEEKKRYQKQQQVEKKKEEPKEKPPKSIEEALNNIDVKAVQDLLASGKARFPSAPLIWLKDLVAYLNSKIPVDKDDPFFSGKPKGYPVNIVPKGIRTTLENALNSSGSQNTQLFYEFVLTAMVTDMAKGVPVVGYKIFLQLLAKHNPKMASANIGKLMSLKNSYQNRKTIGLTLLWAITQSGLEDFNVGLKVWHEVMSPMLEAKNYSNHIINIINDFLSCHENYTQLTAEIYLNITEDILSGKFNVPAVYTNHCIRISEKLRTILFQNKSVNYRKLFETLMSKLTPKTTPNHKDEMVKALLACLVANDDCFNVWKLLYIKYLYPSHLLLKCIVSNWDSLKKVLKTEYLKETLISFTRINENWKKGKGKDESLIVACKKECQILVVRMTASQQKRGSPWKMRCLFLLFLIGLVLLVDYRTHGSVEEMKTNKYLQNSKICVYGQNAWSTVKLYTDKGFQILERTYPEHYKTVSGFTKSYVKLSSDFCLVIKNASLKIYDNAATYYIKKQPIVKANIEYYVPGLLDTARDYGMKGIQLVKTYSAFLVEKSIDYSTAMTRWMETQVFVGKLSPENLQSYASKAIDTTQTYASQTYDWLYEKVQTLSKVQ